MTEQEKIQKAIPFDVITTLNFPEIEPMISEMVAGVGDFKEAKRYVAMVLCNAAYSYRLETGFYVSRDCHTWAKYNRTTTLREQRISSRKLIIVLDYLVANQYLTEIKGFKDFTDKTNSMRSRYYPTKKFENVISKTSKHTIFATSHSTPIRIKDYHNKPFIPTTLPPEIESKANKINDLNAFYTNFLFTATHDAQKLRLRMNLQASYVGDFKHGGRLYATCTDGTGITFQTLKKSERKTLQINGEATCEPDFKCLHVNLAYILANKELTSDAYDFYPDRKFAKKAVLISLNCTSQEQAVYALFRDPYVTSKNYHIRECELCIELMLARHEAIKPLLFTGKCLGTTLQNIDSDIMLEILTVAKEHNIPILPVHDSCICRKSDKDTVIAIMKTVALSKLGRKLAVSE
jgi:hypothetical protein